jgi:hypothetical protein
VHLAAAGLLLGELDLDAQPLQQPHHRLPRGRKQRVAEAGDEQSDAHWNEFPRLTPWAIRS